MTLDERSERADCTGGVIKTWKQSTSLFTVEVGNAVKNDKTDNVKVYITIDNIQHYVDCASNGHIYTYFYT